MRYLYLFLIVIATASFLIPILYELWLGEIVLEIFNEESLAELKQYLPNIIFFTFISSLSAFFYLFSKDKSAQFMLSNYVEKELSKFSSSKINKIYESTYLLAIILVFSLVYILLYDKTVLEWSTKSEIPILLRLQNPDYLTNDFFTNSVIESPKIIFGHFMNLFSSIGISWLPVLYFLKVTSVISIPVLLFKTYKSISRVWLSSELINEYNGVINQLIFLLSIGLIGLFQFFPQMFPFGWGSMEFSRSVDPMRASFFLGLIFLCLYSSGRPYYFFASLITLFISCLLHPVIALCIFIISLIFIYSAEINFRKTREAILLGLFGLALPSAMMSAIFDDSSYLSSSEFFDIYVQLRHPHHYLASEILNIYSFIWIGLLATPIFLSYKVVNHKILILSVTVFTSILASVFIQYIFTEIYPNKTVMKIGPTRFTSFMSIMFSMNLTILFPSLLSLAKYSDRKDLLFCKLMKLFSNYLSQILFLIQSKINSHLRPVVFLPLTILFIFGISFDNELENSISESELQITQWIRDNTSKDAVIFSPIFDSYLIRIKSERAIYADFSFPFSEKHMKEFSERYRFYIDSRDLVISDYKCLKDKGRGINYIILDNSLSDHLVPVYFNQDWSIYNVEELDCTT